MWLHGCTTACSRDGQAVGCKRHPLRAFARAGNFSQFPKQRCPQRMRGRTHWDSASTGGCYQCPMKGCAPPGKPGLALFTQGTHVRAHAGARTLELTVLPRRAGESPLPAGVGGVGNAARAPAGGLVARGVQEIVDRRRAWRAYKHGKHTCNKHAFPHTRSHAHTYTRTHAHTHTIMHGETGQQTRARQEIREGDEKEREGKNTKEEKPRASRGAGATRALPCGTLA